MLAGRVAEQENAGQRRTGAAPGEVHVELSDDVMLAKLANEGWGEHEFEED